MSKLEKRVREKLRLSGDAPLPARWQAIAAHYDYCMARHGMGLNQAVDLAPSNLSGSNRHDAIRP